MSTNYKIAVRPGQPLEKVLKKFKKETAVIVAEVRKRELDGGMCSRARRKAKDRKAAKRRAKRRG
jgi:ribosomal protein S21